MADTLVYVVAIPLAAEEEPKAVAEMLSLFLDGAEKHVANYRLGEASYEVSPLGVKAALIDVTSKARNPDSFHVAAEKAHNVLDGIVTACDFHTLSSERVRRLIVEARNACAAALGVETW